MSITAGASLEVKSNLKVTGQRVSQVLDCTHIFQPHINVVECTRPYQENIANWVESIPPFMVPLAAEINVSKLNNEPNIQQLRHDIDERLSESWLPEVETIIPDVQSLAELYVYLVDPDSLGIRIRYLTQSMCSKWHQDYVGIRLVSTYGQSDTPGTQWVDSEFIHHERLGFKNKVQGDDSLEVVQDISKIQTMAPFSIGLLKGANWQGNEATPVIHRSPHGDYKRVLVSIDTIP